MHAVCLVSFVFGRLLGQDAYLDARDAEFDSQYATALQGFQNVAKEGGPLAEYAQVRVAACLAEMGKTDQAKKQYRAFIKSHPDGPWSRMAKGGLAMLLFNDDQAADAAPYFTQLLDSPLHPWWYDTYEWAAHENAIDLADSKIQGLPYFTHVVETSIYRPKRRDASRLLAKSTNVDDRLLAVLGLARAGAAKEAQQQLATMAAEAAWPKASRAAITFIAGLIAMHSGKDFDELEPLHLVPNTAWARQALAYEAERLSGMGEFEQARALCDKLVQSSPQSPETADALWRCAYYLRAKRRYKEAIDAYLRVASICPQDRRADNALFDAAELQRLHVGPNEAIATYERVAKSHPDSRLAAEALMREARLYQKAHRKDDALAALKRAAAGPLGHYYVHRAAERFYELDPQDAPKVAPVTVDGRRALVRPKAMVLRADNALPSTILDDVRYQRLSFFGKYGLDEGEWEALDLASSPLEEPWKGLLYRVLAETGFAHTATEYMSEQDREETGAAITAERLRVFYARVHWHHILELSAETGVDPYLILSVGRQESTFRPALTSYAGAKGLMQLMPTTARWMAKVDPAISQADIKRLEDPESSLRLGAYYLRRMLATWDGNIVYALASYNAGAGNVKKWIRAHGHQSLDQFVESIPYSETQGYVKRVLGNYAAYYSLYPSADEAVASLRAKHVATASRNGSGPEPSG